MAWWAGAALGAVGSLYAAKKQKEAQEEMEENQEKALRIYDDLIRTSERMHNRQANILRQGYERAEGTIGGVEQAGLRAIREFGTAAEGSATQRLVNSGLYGSSLGASLSRGIGTDQGRQAQDLYSRLAGLRSGLVAQGAESQGASLAQQIAARNRLGEGKASVQLGVQPTFDTGVYQGLGQAGAYLDHALNQGSSGGGGGSWLSSLFNGWSIPDSPAGYTVK